MKNILNPGTVPLIIFVWASSTLLIGSVTAQEAQYRILIDVAHGQKFWNNPAQMHPKAGGNLERVRYMAGEFTKNASARGATLNFLNDEISSEALHNCDLLFIHIPSLPYKDIEVKALTQYLSNGGALFLVMDVDYWSTLEQTNVNELISPFRIRFGPNSPDTLTGGYTKAGLITGKPLKITYHGGRIVEGGTPFCFNTQTESYPFGVFTELQNGGRLVVMGDGMTSLYMTSWEGVSDYQCSEFMDAVLAWLLR